MHERFKEITGFACRWCLLALAGSAVVAGTWAGVCGAGPMATSLRADVAALDVVCGRSDVTGAVVVISHRDSPGPAGLAHVLASLDDGALMLDWRTTDRLSVTKLPCLREGSFTVRVVGLPYGPVAFRQAEAVVGVAPQKGVVYLVDADTPLGPDQADDSPSRTWRNCVDLLSRKGRVAFFHIGIGPEYYAARQRLRQTFPKVPVEYIPGSVAETQERLWRIVNAINMDVMDAGGRPRLPIIVAVRRDLADHTSRANFPTHLVGPAEPGLTGPRKLLRHESVDAFEQYLRDKAGVDNGGGPT